MLFGMLVLGILKKCAMIFILFTGLFVGYGKSHKMCVSIDYKDYHDVYFYLLAYSQYYSYFYRKLCLCDYFFK